MSIRQENAINDLRLRVIRLEEAVKRFQMQFEQLQLGQDQIAAALNSVMAIPSVSDQIGPPPKKRKRGASAEAGGKPRIEGDEAESAAA